MASCVNDRDATSNSYPAAGEARVYEVVATVVDNAERGAELCRSVRLSRPPQCRGLPITNWNWADVPKPEAAQGVRWGDYRVRVLIDGKVLTLVEAPTRTPITSAVQPDMNELPPDP